MNTVSYILVGVLLGLSVACFLFWKLLPSLSVFIRTPMSAGLQAAALAILFFPNMDGIIPAILTASLLLHSLPIFTVPPLRAFLALLQLTTLLCFLGVLTLVPPALFGIAWALVAFVGLFGFIADCKRVESHFIEQSQYL